MSLDEHAEEGRQQLLATGITTWPEFAAAILFKFGKEFAAFVALVAVLGFCSWLLWGSSNPQAVLDAMGGNAGKVFALNAAFSQVVAQLLTQEGDTARLARLQAILSRIPAHTIHEDGTVTIDRQGEGREP